MWLLIIWSYTHHVLLFCCLGLGRKRAHIHHTHDRVTLRWLFFVYDAICWGTQSIQELSLSINALRAWIYIHIWQLSSFRATTLWFIDLTVATCHIQYAFLTKFFHEKTDKTRKYSKSAIFVWYENGRRQLLGAQSINTERASLRLSDWIKI